MDVDRAGYLVSAPRNSQTTTWQYDSNGNCTQKNGAQIATYDEQDRLLSFKGAAYTHTANGERASKTESGTYLSDVFRRDRVDVGRFSGRADGICPRPSPLRACLPLLFQAVLGDLAVILTGQFVHQFDDGRHFVACD